MRMSRRGVSLTLGMAMLLGACGSKENHAPPAVKRELLAGKWEADDAEQVFQSFEFADDKSLKMTLWHMPEPVTGTYSWSDDGSITVEYILSAEAKKTCTQHLEAFREHKRELGKKAGGQYADKISQSANNYPDVLLDKQDYRVSLSEGKADDLELFSGTGLNFRFKKPSEKK